MYIWNEDLFSPSHTIVVAPVVLTVCTVMPHSPSFHSSSARFSMWLSAISTIVQHKQSVISL
jgi:hypothetical protein